MWNKYIEKRLLQVDSSLDVKTTNSCKFVKLYFCKFVFFSFVREYGTTLPPGGACLYTRFFTKLKHGQEGHARLPTVSKLYSKYNYIAHIWWLNSLIQKLRLKFQDIIYLLHFLMSNCFTCIQPKPTTCDFLSFTFEQR